MTTSMSWATRSAVGIHAGAMPDDGRVALRRGGDVLVAVVDHAHRLAHALRQERRVDGHDRRVLLLAAEAAAGLRLGDDGLLVGEPEGALQRLVDVVGALHRARDGDAAVRSWHRDHGLVLDVELLLVADAILALDDEAGRGERGFDVAAADLVGRELLARRASGSRTGAQRLRAQRDATLRLAQGGPVRRRDERHRLGMVADDISGEGRHVRLDGAHDVLAGDVRGRHDHDAATSRSRGRARCRGGARGPPSSGSWRRTRRRERRGHPCSARLP